MSIYSFSNTDLTTVKTNVGSDADALSSTGSVHGKLKDVKSAVVAIPTSPIKSVQRGIITATVSGGTTQNVTVSAVNMAKATLKLLYNGSIGTGGLYCYYLQLTSSTNIAFVNQSGGALNNISWELVEYN